MASAIIGGLIQQGTPADAFEVVEPFEEARTKLAQSFGIVAKAEAGEALSRCGVVVWAVKPRDLCRSRPRGARLCRRRPAPERGRGHSVRQHRPLAGHGTRGARHAQHARAGGQGHDRPVRPARRREHRPLDGREVAGAHRRADLGRRRTGTRRRDRHVRLGPGVRVLFHRGDDRSRRRDGPARPTKPSGWPSAPSPAPRRWRTARPSLPRCCASA